MPIEFRCTQCQRLLRTPDDTAGKQARCPECGTILPIPALSTHSPIPAPPENEAGGPPPAAVAPAVDASVLPQVEAVRPADDTAAGQPPGQPPEQSPPPVSHSAQDDPSFIPPAELRRYAIGRVVGPSLALMALSGVGVLLQVFAILVGLGWLGILQVFSREAAANAFATGVNAIVLQCLYVAVNVLVIVGALNMFRLQSHGLARVAAVLAMLPFSCVANVSFCCLPMWLIELAAGLWALAVLSDPVVKSAFPD